MNFILEFVAKVLVIEVFYCFGAAFHPMLVSVCT